MNITAEEKLMYEVMKAIYDSGIPMSFKGSMVMKACLMEAGYHEDTRHTVDIDANWNSDAQPSAEQMTQSLQNALSRSGISLDVSLYRMYGEGRSAGFDLVDPATADTLFSMDVDVNRPVQPTQIYMVNGLKFRGISPSQMLADKISAVSSDKVFRRIKDVVDLYYLSHVITFDCQSVIQTIKNSGRTLGDFRGFMNETDSLKHAYDKFRFTGDIHKPVFEEVYQTVRCYIHDMLPEDK